MGLPRDDTAALPSLDNVQNPGETTVVDEYTFTSAFVNLTPNIEHMGPMDTANHLWPNIATGSQIRADRQPVLFSIAVTAG